jgi:hypothetical protein
VFVRRDPPLGFLEQGLAPLADTLAEKLPPVAGEAEEITKVDAHY